VKRFDRDMHSLRAAKEGLARRLSEITKTPVSARRLFQNAAGNWCLVQPWVWTGAAYVWARWEYDADARQWACVETGDMDYGETFQQKPGQGGDVLGVPPF
jgi:hypothetical protein